MIEDNDNSFFFIFIKGSIVVYLWFIVWLYMFILSKK